MKRSVNVKKRLAANFLPRGMSSPGALPEVVFHKVDSNDEPSYGRISASSAPVVMNNVELHITNDQPTLNMIKESPELTRALIKASAIGDIQSTSLNTVPSAEHQLVKLNFNNLAFEDAKGRPVTGGESAILMPEARQMWILHPRVEEPSTLNKEIYYHGTPNLSFNAKTLKPDGTYPIESQSKQDKSVLVEGPRLWAAEDIETAAGYAGKDGRIIVIELDKTDDSFHDHGKDISTSETPTVLGVLQRGKENEWHVDNPPPIETFTWPNNTEKPMPESAMPKWKPLGAKNIQPKKEMLVLPITPPRRRKPTATAAGAQEGKGQNVTVRMGKKQ